MAKVDCLSKTGKVSDTEEWIYPCYKEYYILIDKLYSLLVTCMSLSHVCVTISVDMSLYRFSESLSCRQQSRIREEMGITRKGL